MGGKQKRGQRGEVKELDRGRSCMVFKAALEFEFRALCLLGALPLVL
jgi:hypothetical protein